ncbi:MAG TPA: translocation/assembly module TamB domain-containing protein [Rhabdochlamydiaceae bacterium]|nr:translocation/assembly module TamB domain-containing protein [Rhabdochlamydiaceae bacterium]
MMRKHLYRISRVMWIGLIVLLFVLSFLFASFQTKWAKKQVRNLIIETAQKNGIQMSISPVEGSLPFKLTIKNVDMHVTSEDRVFIKTIKLRISPFALLRKEIAIRYLSFHDVSYLFSRKKDQGPAQLALPTMEELHTQLSTFSFPFNISIKTFKVPSLLVENITTEESAVFSIRASGKLKKGANEFFLNCKVNGPPYFASYVDLFLKGNKREQYVGGSVKLQLKSAEALNPFFHLPFDPDCTVQTSMEGPWNTWVDLITSDSSGIKTPPLQGIFQARVNHLAMPGYEELDQKCKVHSIFTISQDFDLNVKKFVLDSDVAEIKGKVDIGRGAHLNSGSLTFSFPRLSMLNHHLPFKVQGALTGQGKFDSSTGSFHFSTSDLNIENSSYHSIHGQINSVLEGTIWNGQVKFQAEHPNLPIEMHANFAFEPGTFFSMPDVDIEGPEAQITGNIDYLFKQKQFDCLALAHILQLGRFQELVPNAVIDGSIGAEAHFSSQKLEGETHPQEELKLDLLAKNVRYKDTFIHEVNVHSDLTNLSSDPRGSITLEADKAFHPQLYLSSLFANLFWQDDQWPFYLNVQGTCREPFDLLTTGSLAKEKENIKIDFVQIAGSAMNTLFNLEQPFEMNFGPQYFRISQCDFKVQDGFFHALLDFSKEAAKADIKAQHFPLDFFALALPHFYLKGTSSLNVFLDANDQRAVGSMNLLLEQANIYQKGKKSLLNAKGALNVGLEQNIAQIHANLIASDQQFFDWSATLPIKYSIFPFHIKCDQNKPISSELTMEGKLEEIFDFVNFGTHQATGLLSCHLFLSKNLSSPAINGSLELQSGTYENYFTGTQLREINALIKAENNKIILECVTATDAQEGNVSAKGDLLLSPKDQFPFKIQADLADLNCLRSELVNSNFTGDVTIKGDSRSAQAKGSLEVSEAHIRIPDELTHEIPQLQVKFINQPPHIRASFVQAPSVYPVGLDLDLSAPNKIFVQGKGLDSEWHGKVHLSGTNTDYAANGELNLLSGKFVFAGKTFSLTEGEITFTDKPNANAYLSLSGTLPLQNITITAFLRGPLTAPMLTFQSLPQMATSSLLSYVLFDKDISEINYLQAFQLAQVVVSLSGGDGPGVFEKIRKTLGIDRIGLVAGPKGIQQVGVQIGKYLTKGVLITLSQSAEASQVVLEVTLKEGFVFQAETQEDNAGKFILKWHRNY